MTNDLELKQIVKEKYSQIAEQSVKSNCGCCCSEQDFDFNMIGDDYKNVKGHFNEADLGLGCGIPTEFAQIDEGDTVLDLGSGAGNDVFIARTIVGENGKVIGVDMTKEMIDRANKNNEKLNFKNVEFRFGEIEELPVDSNSVDVVISNCVLNLVPNKQKAFAEIFRVLKPNSHFCVSDVVLKGELPSELKKSAEMYAGCVSGAMKKEEYLQIIENAGFKNIEVKKTKTISLPDKLLNSFLERDQVVKYKNNEFGIISITVVGNKK